MRIDPNLTDEAVLAELGERLAALRLARDLTQAKLGEQSGVGRTVVQRIETGLPVTTVNLVRVLRVLDALDALDRLIPQQVPSPLEELKLRGRQRRRASGNRPEGAEEPRPWRWGDES
jgi:transcriptional regulator with XRE-family HTH domain